MLKFFAEKMWVAFAVQKLLTFFSAKTIRILCIESAKTVNEMTLNELVKLTTLWTTGPRMLGKAFSRLFSYGSSENRFWHFVQTISQTGVTVIGLRAFWNLIEHASYNSWPQLAWFSFEYTICITITLEIPSSRHHHSWSRHIPEVNKTF